jgi:predicted small integral membrane protein
VSVAYQVDLASITRMCEGLISMLSMAWNDLAWLGHESTNSKQQRNNYLVPKLRVVAVAVVVMVMVVMVKKKETTTIQREIK